MKFLVHIALLQWLFFLFNQVSESWVLVTLHFLWRECACLLLWFVLGACAGRASWGEHRLFAILQWLGLPETTKLVSIQHALSPPRLMLWFVLKFPWTLKGWCPLRYDANLLGCYFVSHLPACDLMEFSRPKCRVHLVVWLCLYSCLCFFVYDLVLGNLPM